MSGECILSNGFQKSFSVDKSSVECVLRTSKETGKKQEGYRMHSVSKQMGTEWVGMGMGFGYRTGIQQIQNR